MADPVAADTLGPLVARLRLALTGLAAGAGVVARAAEAALVQARDSADYERVLQSLGELAAAGAAVTDGIREGIAHTEKLRHEWEAAHRYTEEGLEALRLELDGLAHRPYEAVRRWLNEILDAIRASELDAAVTIAEWPLPVDEKLAGGCGPVREQVRRVRDGDLTGGLELTETLAEGGVPGWERVLDSTLRARAHRLAAEFSVRSADDGKRALEHATRAVETEPRSGVNYAQRGVVSIFLGDFDRAASDGEQALDLSPDDPSGYLVLGLWAELTGEFDDAERLYGQALARMTTHAVATLKRRWSMIEPSGLLLALAAELLLDARRLEAALELADAASAEGVRGRAASPDARVHRVRHLALAQLPGRRADAAAAAVDAGTRFNLSNDSELALAELRAAMELDENIRGARWPLADVLVRTSFGTDTGAPDTDVVDEAMRLWNEEVERFGPPEGADSWAYLVRAIAHNLYSLSHKSDPADDWEAVLDVERALLHDPWDGRRWGFAARYLRVCGRDELAFEAAERGYELSAADDIVLGERMALLGNMGRFGESNEIAEQLVSLYGEDPWVLGVQAWLALHDERYEDALARLESPLGETFDLSYYYDLRALSHAALGQIDEARADYGAVVAGVADDRIPVVDARVKCFVAVADAVAGDPDRAHRSLETIAPDDVMATDDVSLPAVQALVALAHDELERGEELLRQAVQLTETARDLDDLATHFPRRLGLLRGDAEQRTRREEAARRGLESAPARRAELASVPMPDAELDLVPPTAEPGDTAAEVAAVEVATAALLAVAARRQVDARDYAEAADSYARLRSTHRFDPEASTGLITTLGLLRDEAVAAGDAVTTRRALDGLVELGESDAIERALDVAAALRTAGDSAGARAELAAVADSAREAGKRDRVERALADLCLADGDADGAVRHVELALELAGTTANPTLLAQLETHAAVASLLAGNQGVSAHVDSAIRRWGEAGVFDPLRATVEEARALTSDDSGSKQLQQAVESLTALVEERGTTPSSSTA